MCHQRPDKASGRAGPQSPVTSSGAYSPFVRSCQDVGCHRRRFPGPPRRVRAGGSTLLQLAHHHLASMDQAERGAVAKRAGQRSPSEKTWALVMRKLEKRRAA